MADAVQLIPETDQPGTAFIVRRTTEATLDAHLRCEVSSENLWHNPHSRRCGGKEEEQRCRKEDGPT